MANTGDVYLLQNTLKESDVIENFRRIQLFFRQNPLLNCGFVFREVEVPTAALSNFSFKHNLKFIPKDVLVLAISNDATVIWHHADFDRDFIYLTASAACNIRVLLGTYKDENE